MKKIKINFILLFIFNANLFAQVDGTTGLPLGGIGTGALKFNAGAGTFSSNFRTPTRNGDFQSLTDAQFQIFTQRGGSVVTSQKLIAVQNNGRVDDDAVFPLHRVNFGEINNVSVNLTAYIPYNPDDITEMCHPAALFEFSLENLLNEQVTVSLAFQIRTSSVPEAINDSGFISASSSLQLCLIGSLLNGDGDLTYGSDNGFFTNGNCNNQLTGLINRLALRVTLNAAETKNLRFVLTWYKPDEPERYRYTVYWNDAHEAAASALNNFDAFKNNCEILVNRMRDSNLPSWLTDQTLNSLVNLINNSVYLSDGRYCHTEGMWTPEGTMDQMWHARQIYTMINPDLAWIELEWWARTQHVLNYTGQIHHDLGENFNYVDWDDTEHSDYRSIYEWVDLNCGFIISVYEAFLATADQDKLNYFWPYVKKAAQRILDQLEIYGSSQYPYTFSSSLSSYDAGGNSQAYNTGLSIVTYHIMTYLAGIMGEQQIIDLYQNAFQNAVISFEDRWLDNPYPAANYCESAFGGPWISNFFKLGSYWEREKLNNLFMTVINYYNPLNNGMGLFNGSYSEWQTYLVGHLGGFSLQTGRSNIWQALQEDMYERNYLNRNLVFNQQLGIPSKVYTPTWIATSNSGTNQYISIPVLWRNYYSITGYHRNEYSDELWLEPGLYASLNHQLQDALIITPDGYAAINYNAYGVSYQNQEITFLPDFEMDVSSLYIWDLYADSANSIYLVKVNGTDTDFSRIKNGDQAHLKINWKGTILPGSGITIQAEGEPKPGNIIPSAPENFQGEGLNPSQILLKWNPVPEDIYGYIVEIKSGETFRTIGQTASQDTFYLDTGLLKSTSYSYRVRSFNSETVSDPSDEIILATEDGGNGDVITALNAGGSSYLSTESIQYIGDASSGWVSGGNTYTTTSAISNTTDDVLYQTERYGNFSYSIPLENGSYHLVLKFAEIYQETPGTRIFHVDVEGDRFIRNLDLFLRTGNYSAYDVVVPLELNDGILNINLVTVTDNAKLSALEIRRSVVGVYEFLYPEIPETYFFDQNYPNPFNPITHIRYSLPEETHVAITVHNILGEKISVLVDERKPAGYYETGFSAGNLPSGIYFCRIKAGEFQAVRKMLLLK